MGSRMVYRFFFLAARALTQNDGIGREDGKVGVQLLNAQELAVISTETRSKTRKAPPPTTTRPKSQTYV